MAFWHVLWSQEAAGWAQAIGTLAAIVATAWIAGRESRKDAKAQSQRARLILELAANVAGEVYLITREEPALPKPVFKEQVDALRSVLDHLPKEHLSAPDAAVAIIELERALGEYWITYNFELPHERLEKSRNDIQTQIAILNIHRAALRQ